MIVQIAFFSKVVPARCADEKHSTAKFQGFLKSNIDQEAIVTGAHTGSHERNLKNNIHACLY